MIGVFGGSFDPIHYGHLRPVAQVARALALTSVHFVVAARPPHRSPPVANAEQRLVMVRLALAEFPEFVADEREYHRPGPSYMVDTLESFRLEQGDRPVSLLLGLDAFLGLPTWHDWERIPALAHLVVIQRPGWSLSDLPAWAHGRLAVERRQLECEPAGRVWLQEVKPEPISATAIRAALGRHEPVVGLLPESVLGYIRDNRLYCSQ